MRHDIMVLGIITRVLGIFEKKPVIWNLILNWNKNYLKEMRVVK